MGRIVRLFSDLMKGPQSTPHKTGLPFAPASTDEELSVKYNQWPVWPKSVRDAARILSRITYKPNATFRLVYDQKCAQCEVYLELEVPSRTDPRRVITVQSRSCSFLASDVDAPYLSNIARAVCQDWELHEVDEWLRVDGTLLTDPHTHERRFS